MFLLKKCNNIKINKDKINKIMLNNKHLCNFYYNISLNKIKNIINNKNNNYIINY